MCVIFITNIHSDFNKTNFAKSFAFLLWFKSEAANGSNVSLDDTIVLTENAKMEDMKFEDWLDQDRPGDVKNLSLS